MRMKLRSLVTDLPAVVKEKEVGPLGADEREKNEKKFYFKK